MVLTYDMWAGIYRFMNKTDEYILRTAKEIIVKFIEMGRLSPSNIHESFKDVYSTVNETVKANVKKEILPNDQQT